MGTLQFRLALAVVSGAALFLTGCPDPQGKDNQGGGKEAKPAVQLSPVAKGADGASKDKPPRKDGDKPEITAEQLQTVKEGFARVQQIVPSQGKGVPSVTLEQFAKMLRVAKESADKVGGPEALARTAEALAELNGTIESKEAPRNDGDKSKITLEQLKTVKEGFARVQQISPYWEKNGLTLEQFAKVLRVAKELADKVGGMEALAQGAEALADLTSASDGKSKR